MDYERIVSLLQQLPEDEQSYLLRLIELSVDEYAASLPAFAFAVG